MKVLSLGSEQFQIDESDFTVDRSNIDGELCKLPNRLIYYGQIEARFRLAFETSKANLEKLEADLDDTIRAQYKGDKRQTEAQVRNEVIRSSQYQIAQKEHLDIQYQWNTSRWITNALESKKDILISLSYTDRQLSKLDKYN